MTARLLSVGELAWRCDPASLGLDPADADKVPGDIVGQDRARAAALFAIGMPHDGYHLFIAGPSGTGKRSLARAVIETHANKNSTRRFDWVYVNNFEHPHKPIALRLPPGRGARLRAAMRALVEELRTTIPAAFDSEEHVAELERLNAEFKERTERGLNEIGDAAQERGLHMLRTPVGFTFAPKKNAEVMTPQEFEALPLAERQRLEHAVVELQERLVHALRASMRLRKEHADRLRSLNRVTTQLAAEHAIDDLKAEFSDLPAVLAYLDAVRGDVVDNAGAFRTHEDGEAGAATLAQPNELARYEVNLVVDAGGMDGASIIEADLPSLHSLVGRIDHTAHFGMLLTDFRHIKAGLLHRSNGAYLLIDALKLLSQPFAWNALKRALLSKQIRIESMAEMLSLASTTQLEPEPIALDLKVVLTGPREICQLLQAYDPEFEPLFRVVADMDEDMQNTAQTQRDLARTLAAQARARGLPEAEPTAMARLVEHGARRSGDALRISAGLRHLLDVLVEAGRLAQADERARTALGDVQAAIASRRERAGRVDSRLRESMLRDLLQISTSGEQVGQVNGMAAYQVGDEVFGIPSRITATVRLGEGQVLDIQRETRMGGPLHAKGVMILASFLAARFSRFQPYSIVASLVFEQTYGLVEGDSASLAELLALLACIGDLPVRQGIAVTGSVDQLGHVQAVGAVNEKIEAFFDLCAARGLDGSQGVILPASNAPQLMLREDLVGAAAQGRFAVRAVSTVDEALEVLTGLPAGSPNAPNEDSANGRIAKRLREYALIRRGDKPRARRGPAYSTGRASVHGPNHQ